MLEKPEVYKFTSDNLVTDAKIKISDEKRSIVNGVVYNSEDKPLKDAVVKLYIVENGNSDIIHGVSYTFTDENGEFLFGPLTNSSNYLIKVWYDNKDSSPIEIQTEQIDDISAYLKEANINASEFGVGMEINH